MLLQQMRTYLLICLMLAVIPKAFAQPTQYDTLLQAKGHAQLDKLYDWYSLHIRYYDSSNAMLAIDGLRQAAQQQHNKAALAAAIFYKGQYLAVKERKEDKGIAYMQQGIAMAEEDQEELEAAEFTHHLGYYYFFKKQYATALACMLKANYVFQKVGYGSIREQGYQLYRLAFVYYHLRNYHEALKHLQTALQYPISKPIVEIFILNTTGQCYRELYQFDSAKLYFLKAYRTAATTKDTTWMGVTSGNIGNLHLNNRDYAGALPFLTDYYRFSVVSKDQTCISEALMGLADIDVFYGRYNQALLRLQEADATYHAKPGDIQVEDYARQGYLYNTFSRAWEGIGNAEQSLHYRKLADEVRDSIDRRARLSNDMAIQQLLETEQHTNEIKLLEKEKHNALLKQYFVIAAAVLLIIIFLLSYNRQLLKRKKDRALLEKKEAILQSEKAKIEADLQHATAMLNSYVENLQQKTALLDKVQTEIQLLQHQTINQDEELMFLQRLNDSTILTEEQWHGFRELFEKVHSGFFIKLKTTYPQLTPAETRLCALTKLQLGTKEMASMLGVNADTIKKTRQRLRKKIGISEETSLEEVMGAL